MGFVERSSSAFEPAMQRRPADVVIEHIESTNRQDTEIQGKRRGVSDLDRDAVVVRLGKMERAKMDLAACSNAAPRADREQARLKQLQAARRPVDGDRLALEGFVARQGRARRKAERRIDERTGVEVAGRRTTRVGVAGDLTYL